MHTFGSDAARNANTVINEYKGGHRANCLQSGESITEWLITVAQNVIYTVLM